MERADVYREMAWEMARADGIERPGPLNIARRLDRIAREADRERDRLVIENADRFTWSYIARVMDVTRSTAHRLWGGRR